MTRQERIRIWTEDSEFYTKTDIAKECIRKSIKFLEDNSIDINKVLFVEPSAGTGNFYFNMLDNGPVKAFDIKVNEDNKHWCEQKDFLKVEDLQSDKEIIFFIGNPPYNKGLSLKFINHITKVWGNKQILIGFILQGSFNINNSVNKSIKLKRENELDLYINDELDINSFIFPDDSVCRMVTVFQIYGNMKNLKSVPIEVKKIKSSIDEWVKVVHINTNPLKKTKLTHDDPSNPKKWEYVMDENLDFVYVTTGEKYIKDIYYFIPMNTYESNKHQFKLYRNYYDSSNKIGFGFILGKDRVKIKKLIRDTDWYSLTHQLINGSFAISKQTILKYLTAEINKLK